MRQTEKGFKSDVETVFAPRLEGGYDGGMVKAVFAGTFDPPTNGHFDIIRRADELFDRLDVVLAVNIRKEPLLAADVRKRLLEGEIERMGLKSVRVRMHEGLIADYCRNEGAGVLVRGIRSAADYDYETEQAMFNKQLNPDVETVFLAARPELSMLRSSSIRVLMSFKGDVSSMVPRSVLEVLEGFSL